MSSLQKQLAVIAASSTYELDLKAQKTAHSKSLIFEPHIATTQSFDTVYQICVEGYQDICALDSRFTRFSDSLFSRQSIREDRVHMSTLANEDLDNVLDAFLRLVGGRLLLTPALKAVEWLVRRFRVHEYNTVSLVLAFLPYHATPIFQPLLSILPAQLPSFLKFLHPYAGSLTCPSRAALIQAAVHNSGFFSALNNYVLKCCRAAAHGQSLLSFWAAICAQTIERLLQHSQSGRQNVQIRRQEDLMLQMLPVLEEGLAMKSAPELMLGCYTVLAILVTRASLEESTLDALTVTVAANWNSETISAGLSCLGIIAERKHTCKLPRAALECISRVKLLKERIQGLEASQRMDKLVIGILQGAFVQSQGWEPQEIASVANWVLLQQSFGSELKTWLRNSVLEKSFDDASNSSASEIQAETPITPFGAENVDPHSSVLSEGNVERNVDASAISPTGLPTFADSIEFGRADNETHSRSANACEASRLLNRQELTVASFLTDSLLPEYELLRASFLEHYQENKLEEFTTLPLFEGGLLSRTPLLLTFMISVSCVDPSADIRSVALRTIRDCTLQLQTAPADLQILIPYSLVALADSSPRVRRSAADLFLALHGVFARSQWKIETNTTETLWERSQLYPGFQGELRTIPCRVAAKFVKDCVLPNLEECVSDNEVVESMLKASLGSSASKGEGKDSKKLKSSAREGIFSMLSDSIRATKLLGVKAKALKMMTNISKVAGQPRSIYLLPCLREWSSFSHTYLQSLCKHERVDLEELDFLHARVIHPADQQSLEYSLSLINTELDCPRQSLRLAALKQLGRLWKKMGPDSQSQTAAVLFSFGFRVAFNGKDDACQKEARTFFKDVALSSEIIVGLVNNVIGAVEVSSEPTAAKRRRANNHTAIVDRSAELGSQATLSKLTFVLELVEQSQGQENAALFSALLNVLQTLQQMRIYFGIELGYLHFLNLHSLYKLAQALRIQDSSMIEDSLLRVDLVVECARTTSSPQARNAAFLFLSEISKHKPRIVLRSLMPIFTLMSTTTMKESDDFSVHVVDKTIQEVVPLLAKTLREQNEDIVSAAAEIMFSFAAAFDHIPHHRRLRLFSLLATCLGPEKCLFAIIITLLDSHPSHPGAIRFASALPLEFDSFIVLTTVSKYLDFISDCLRQKPCSYQVLIKKMDENGNNALDLAAKFLSALPKLLQGIQLQSKLRQSLASDASNAEPTQDLFGTVLEQVLAVSRDVGNDQNLRQTCSELIRHLLGILPFKDLPKAIDSLMDKIDDATSVKVLQAFDSHLKSEVALDSVSKRAVVDLFPRLSDILRKSAVVPVKCAVIAAADQICERFGKLDNTKVLGLAHTLADYCLTESEDRVLRALSLHALSTTIPILGNEFIPLLKQSWNAGMSCLREVVTTDENLDLRLHNAAFAFFTSAAETLPFMLTIELFGPVLTLANASAKRISDTTGQAICKDFLHLAAIRLEPATTIQAVLQEWPSAFEDGILILNQLTSVFQTTIEYASKSSIHRNNRLISDAFLAALDLRRQVGPDQIAKNNNFSVTEEHVVGTLISFVLKINDATFRPFFMRLIEWAESSPDNNASSKSARLTVLFKFLYSLSERLKSISTVYFGFVVHLFKSALETDLTHSADATLVVSVLQALKSSFEHDQDDFWQAPSHSTSLMATLVAQLAKLPLSFVRANVIPAITEFAVAIASNAHRKSLNFSILKLARSDKSRTRMAAVNCEQAITHRLGDEWLTHLPEMLPFISELQEDDDEEVEQQTRAWIKQISEKLGEDLDSMLD